jgi:hypothetical protein
MKLKSLLVMVSLSISIHCLGGWTDLNTGINDDLKGVAFYSSSNGLVCGNKGIYYTTTGGAGPANWTRFKITSNYADSLVYEGTKFTALQVWSTNTAYLCGQDTVNNKAVIFYLNISTLTYSIPYTGYVGSALNAMTAGGGILYAVGDNGLVLRKQSAGFVPVSSGTTANLKSITTFYPSVFIVGGNTYLKGNDSGSSLNITTNLILSSVNLNSIAAKNATSLGAVGANGYSLTSGGSLTTNSNYDFGPLNGNDIYYFSTEYFIGTDHGIYSTVGGMSGVIEYQVTSGNVSISDIYFNTPTLGFACGASGVVLKTTNFGAPSQPYATNSISIGCRGEASTLTGNPGSASSCKWEVNDSTIGTTCNMTYNFPVSGTYTLSYIVWNTSGLYDTVNHIIHILDPPNVNVSYYFEDSAICRKEALNIHIDSSFINFFYQLKKYGSTNIYGQQAGNGAHLAFESDSLNSPGNYYLFAQAFLSQCYKSFPDTIPVLLENTKANFSCSNINAYLGEQVNYYEKTYDAQHFSWAFTSGGGTTYSSVADPTGISYTVPGTTTVKLICWSNNGCYDTINEAGAMICAMPSPIDSCWAYNNDETDPTWTGYSAARIGTGKKTNYGYVIAGTGYLTEFNSLLGTIPDRTAQGGSYLASYSFDGMLRWVARSKDVSYANSTGWYTSKPRIYSVDTDSNGNIYITGYENRDVYFYTPNGDSVRLSRDPSMLNQFYSFVAKLDPQGNLIWNAIMNNAFPSRIKVEKRTGDVYITGSMLSGASYVKNGISTSIFQVSTANRFLLKLDEYGTMKWTTPIYLNNVNGAGINDLDFDKYGNAYVIGFYEMNAAFYSPDLSSSISIPIAPGYTYGSKFFLIKYDSLGSPLWLTREDITGKGSACYSIHADTTGSIYVTGLFRGSPPWDKWHLIKTDGTIDTLSIGKYIMLKFNSAGYLQFHVGNNYSYTGSGFGITRKDNIISVIGTFAQNTYDTWTSTMTSTVGAGQSVTIGQGDYFIANYDTAGVLINVHSTGHNPTAPSPSGPSLFFRDYGGNYYFGGDCRGYIGYNIDYCGDIMEPSGSDGFVAKMSATGCVMPVITNLDTEDKKGYILIYPNPTKDEVFIDPGDYENYSVRILDMLGKTVYSKNGLTSKISLKMNEFGLGNGLYFVELISKEKHEIRKIIFSN